MKKVLVSLAFVSASVFGMTNVSYHDLRSSTSQKRVDSEENFQNLSKKQKTEYIYETTEFSLVESDSECTSSDSDKETIFFENELIDDKFALSDTEKTQIDNFNNWIRLSYENSCNLIEAIIQKKHRNTVMSDYGMSKTTYSRRRCEINLWSNLPENTRNKIIDIVATKKLPSEKLGTMRTAYGKKLNLDILVTLMIEGETVDLKKYGVEFCKKWKRDDYVRHSKTWNILAQKGWKLSKQDLDDTVTKFTKAIINKHSKSSICRELGIKNGTYQDYLFYVKLWCSMPKSKRDKIISIVKNNDSDTEELGTVKTRFKTEYDIKTIIKLITNEAYEKEHLRTKINLNKYEKYLICAKIWKVLTEKAWEPPKKDAAYDKTKDFVFHILDPKYTNENGKKIHVSSAVKWSYSGPINSWKKLKNKQRQIIEIVQNDRNCKNDMGKTQTPAGKELDIKIILDLIKAGKGNKTSVLKDYNVEKIFHRSYATYSQVWEVLAKESIVL